MLSTSSESIEHTSIIQTDLSSNDNSTSDFMDADEPAIVTMHSEAQERGETVTPEITNAEALASFQRLLEPIESGTEFPQHNGKLLIGENLLNYLTTQYDTELDEQSSMEQNSASDIEFFGSLREKYATAKCAFPQSGNYWRIWRKFKN